ncbi:MAG: hypothetical protein GF308_03615 [Candidatus Heimdallarchaeota archaeon]|nr:hypothetical protein [Candidatus Heimdallarchaeota archaeon]
MEILVITSCSKKKAESHINQPSCDEINSKYDRKKYLGTFVEKRATRDMYQGAMNISINSAIKKLREFFEVEYYILSAGFGLLQEDWKIPPYNCTFSNMTKKEILERAKLLEIPKDYKKILVKTNPSLIYLALGKDYLLSLGNWDENLPCTTIAFSPSDSEKVISFPADYITVKKVSSRSGVPIHGVVGFKGDLLLILANYLLSQKNPEESLQKLLSETDILKYLLTSSKIRKDQSIDNFL